MGVPAFFRWIVEHYPKCLKPAVEVDENIFLLNKNGEFDSLYIDANDLLHTAVHPENAASPKSFKHMMENFLYLIEQQVKIIRPRSQLYIAFDGVAPRAKMNLQRSRRYRVAKEQEAKKDYMKKIDIYRKDHDLDCDEEVDEPFNFSCITPGTPFMRDVSLALQEWIRKQQMDNSYWSNLYIVVDDSSVAGEGEHKICQRIRSSRQHPNYNPQNAIAISGRDADLILLSLATHEPNVSILREVTYFGKMVRCPMCHRAGHARECVYPPKQLAHTPEVGYALFSLKTFRSFLFGEFREASQRHTPHIDFEIMLNDYVLLTFFVGNDFLPRVAGTCIRNGSLDLLIECYITFVTIHGTTLSNAEGKIDPTHLKEFMKLVGAHERETVGTLAKLNRNNIYKKKKRKKDENSSFYKFSAGAFGNDGTEKMKQSREQLKELFPTSIFDETSIQWFNGLSKKHMLRYLNLAMFEVPAFMRGRNRVFKALGQWKKRYYNSNFTLNIPNDIRDHDLSSDKEIQCILRQYMRGLQWVFQYYIDINPNWEWHFPFAYGPCITDLANIDFNPDEHFMADEPIAPLISLMAVLPPQSIHLIPEVFHPLINFSESPIADLYPETCTVDYNDAFYWWQGIMHLPHMETERISTAALPLMSKLTEEQLQLNQFGSPILFCCSPICELGESLYSEYVAMGSGEEQALPQKLLVKDEFAVFGRAVEAIPNFEVIQKDDGKTRLTSVAAYLIPHERPSVDFKVREGAGLGYDPEMQGHANTRQRFGSLASSRKSTIANQRREMVKEMKVLGHAPNKRGARNQRAGRSQQQNKSKGQLDMLMQAMQMLQMAGANPEQMSQLFNSRSENNQFRDQEQMMHPMSVPNPNVMGGGRQPYQSVMKPMSNDKKGEKARHGEPDPDMDRQQWNNQGNFGNNNNPLSAMQQMAAMLQMTQEVQNPMASLLNQMMNQMSNQMSPQMTQQMMAMLMSQQMNQMSPRGHMGMGFQNQNMMQMMQQQMMMQNMMQRMQSQQMDYPSEDPMANMMPGMGGMGMQDAGFNQNQFIESMMNQAMSPGMSPGPGSPMGGMPSPSQRFASPMDSPTMTPNASDMASPGPFGNQMQQGFWPNSPQSSPSPFGMNNQMQQGMSPMSQQGMNPMSPQGMNPMNQNMMFNQMNPSGFGGNLGYMTNQNNMNNNSQTRI